MGKCVMERSRENMATLLSSGERPNKQQRINLKTTLKVRWITLVEELL